LLKYIPEYILSAYDKGDYQGRFEGYALFFDISGFTRFTEYYAAKGRKGALEINKSLQQIFNPVVDTIEAYNGIITGYAGDSLIAVFPQISSAGMIKVTLQIKLTLQELQNTDMGARINNLSGRIAVSYGEIKWEIITNSLQNEYYFWGEAVSECCELAKYKKLLLFSTTAARESGVEKFKDLGYGYIPEIDLKDHVNKSQQVIYHYVADIAQDFIRNELRTIDVENEFRDVACAFVSLAAIAEEDRNTTICQLLALSAQYGGYFNKLDYSDKGLVALVIFGAPRQTEKLLERMADFAFEAVNRIANVKVGLARGRSYVGYAGSDTRREYTILGFTPNLASRLMEIAEYDAILVDKFTQDQLKGKYKFVLQGNMQMKGLQQEIAVYKCHSKIIRNILFSHSQFVGRKHELQIIRDNYQQVIQSDSRIAFYIHGEPGLGKSRLIDRAKEELTQENITWCLLICDGILRQAYAPVSRFLNNYFQIDQQESPAKQVEVFKANWQDFAQGNKELLRIKSFIANLAGIHWGNSLFSQLPDASRPIQLKRALIILFTHLASRKPLIINIDDAQWIDPYTADFLQEMTSNADTGKIMVISSCRYLDDGSQVDLQLSGLEKVDLILNRLQVSSTQKLVRNILQLAYIPRETEQFIIMKSQSNPLFVEQITWYLQEQNLIDSDGFLRANIEYVNAFGIVDIIGARIDSLTEDMRKIVFYASVLGMEFNTRILSDMLGDDLSQKLEAGVGSNVWTKMNEFEYIFTHILLRDTAYSRMLTNKQNELHLLAATCYEKTLGDDADIKRYEIAGFHFDKAGNKLKAAECYLQAGKIARGEFRLDEASNFYNIAYKIHQEYEPDNALLLADDLHLISVIQCIRSHHIEGIKNLLQVADVYQSKLGLSNDKIIAVYKDLAIAYRESLDYVNSMVYSNKELAILKARHGEYHPQICQVYNRIGLIYFMKADYHKTRKYFNMAVDVLHNCQGDNLSDWVLTFGYLALISHVENDLDKALEYNLKTMEINSTLYSPDHYEIGRGNINLAGIYKAMHRYEEAKACLLKAARIQIMVTGKNHPRLASIYGTLSEIELDQDNIAEALSYVQQAYEIAKTMLGDKHPDTATYLLTIGKINLETEDLQAAWETIKECLEIREEVLGTENPYTAEVWFVYAQYLIKMQKPLESLSYLKRSHQLFSKLYGKNHPLAEEVNRYIADVYMGQGEYSEAVELYLESLTHIEEQKHVSEAETALLNYNIGRCYLEIKQKDNATHYLIRAWSSYKEEASDPTLKKELKKLLKHLKAKL
jgi:class 3 adenylate cyclase/tetratricopeptide (TPR) repeat protein